jgi:pyrroline-5-carboxylate reductase
MVGSVCARATVDDEAAGDTLDERTGRRGVSSMDYEIGFIGAGQMGSAVLKGAVRAGVINASQCIVVEPDDARRDAAAQLGCAVAEEAKAARRCPVIVFAVKPQTFADAAQSLDELQSDTVVVSVMAGLSSGVIRAALGGKCRVVRVMPNTPCQIGAGMAAIALGAGAQPGDDALARRLFEPIGKVITIDEKHMYAVTAVSGSGPAYVFLLAEAMERAATELGIPPEAARTLVMQTILGAARLMDESDQLPGQLREAVTSPGGTTAAALRVMFERKLPEIVVAAITAARDRGRELDRRP